MSFNKVIGAFWAFISFVSILQGFGLILGPHHEQAIIMFAGSSALSRTFFIEDRLKKAERSLAGATP